MTRVKRDRAATSAVHGIPEKLVDLLVDCVGIHEDALTLDAKLVEDLGCDSLDIVEISMECEKEFGVEIDDEATEKWETGTVGDVLAELRRQGVQV